jgi:hypothetical protein
MFEESFFPHADGGHLTKQIHNDSTSHTYKVYVQPTQSATTAIATKQQQQR